MEAALEGDQRAVARVVTHVSEGDAAGHQLVGDLYRRGGKASITGITGAPGAGKSTLVSGLVAAMQPGPERVAVVAVDPSSPFSGGAILGDRIRMGEHSDDPNVFIRSVANRGHLGGIASSTPAVVAALDGLGFTEIVIETVGIGQSEVEIASVCDTTVVVVNPGWGDGVQTAKAGFLEIADIFVVNKADRPEAATTIKELDAMLDLGPSTDWRPPIIATIATDGSGLDDLWNAIKSHRDHLRTGDRMQRIRHDQARHALIGALRDSIDHSIDAIDDDTIDDLVERRVDPWTLADQLLGSTHSSLRTRKQHH